MNFDLSVGSNRKLGSAQHILTEGAGVKLLFALAGIGGGVWLLVSHFVLGINWVYGIFQTQLPPVVIAIFGVFIILAGIWIGTTIKNKQELVICQHGLNVNGEEIPYEEITAIQIKRGFFVTVLVTSNRGVYSYRASKFSHKDNKAVAIVSEFLES